MRSDKAIELAVESVKKENAESRQVFDFIVNWCKPYGIKKVAADLSKDMRADGAVVILVEDYYESMDNDCAGALSSLGLIPQFVIDHTEEEYENDKHIFHVEDVEV